MEQALTKANQATQRIAEVSAVPDVFNIYLL